MPKLTRRSFIASATAAASLRGLPKLAAQPGGKRVLTLVYDKALRMMRAVDRVVH